jgi:hypothetical protein
VAFQAAHIALRPRDRGGVERRCYTVLISPGTVRILPADSAARGTPVPSGGGPGLVLTARGPAPGRVSNWADAAHWLPPGIHRFN